MLDLQKKFDQRLSASSISGILRRAGTMVFVAAIGVGLLVFVLLAAAYFLYKVKHKGMGLLIVFGTVVFLAVAAAWWIGRQLWKQTQELVRNSGSPAMSPFWLNASAVFAIVCC